MKQQQKGLQKGIDFTGITVSYLCHDGSGNVLLNKRGKNCRDEHGRWDGGGGALEFGSTVEETLKREIKEEYCADILEAEFLGFRDIHREFHGQKTYWISLNYKVRIDRKQVKNGEPHKFDEIGWFRLDHLPSPMHSQFPFFLKQFKKKLRDLFPI